MGVHQLFDHVKETTTTTGSGTLTLAGAATGFRDFSVVGNGGQRFFFIAHQSANEWEVSRGVWNTGGTLTRAEVLASSNSGSLVSFSAGTKDVALDCPAAILGENL